ncbi:VWA domain-containing protein [Gimesia chilikensis]|uniref:vWA domain-containing protein n=1 Tax=Gimesia chilikensis TaxID=2605989 RepID=UPI0011EC8E0C|nr:vWA domain-containing protein [Gimesia chilikensis]KAA0139062.1 VWA domain-containing protein [Gimesia chilikensis]
MNLNRFLEKLFGIQSSTWAEGGQWSAQWVGLPSGDRMLFLILGVVVLVAGGWWLYQRDARQIPLLRRCLLYSIRIALVLLVIAMLLEPILVLSKEEKIPSHLLVLLDTSQSMSLKDAWQDEERAMEVARSLGMSSDVDALRRMNRLQLAQKMVTPSFLKDLSADGKRTVHLHGFNDKFNPEALSDSEEWHAGGNATAIASSLRQALLSYSGMPLSGVLLISDGQSTSGEPPEEVLQMLSDEGIPLVAVGMGTTDGPRNVAITELEVSPVVFVQDANQLTVHIESRGMQTQSATLLIEQRRNGGPWQEFIREDVVLNLEGQLQPRTYQFSETKTGKVEFRASIIDAGPEISQDDNLASAEVRVIRQRLNVLFIAGSTFPEVQFLRNTFLRDRQINLSTWLMAADKTYEHPGDLPIRRLPVTQEELNDYDCVILYDPDPNGWPVNFPELLTNFVTKAGGGLVYIAGEMQTANMFDHQSDPTLDWLNLLPVIREPGLFRSQVQIRLSARSPWKLDVTTQGVQDPIFNFASDRQANEQLLKNLPGMFWHFPVTKAKPGATVLAVHADPRMRNEYGQEVLIASQRVGPGWSIFIGFDSTYRWRYLNEQLFDGFWARVVDRAGRSKQLGGNYPFRLSTPKAQYQPGEQAKVIARFLDESQIEPGLQRLYGEVERGDEQPIPLTLTEGNQRGEFSTNFPVPSPGTYFVRVWMGDEAAGASVKAATMPIKVEFPNQELQNPTLNEAYLETMSSSTGGRVYQLSEMNDIVGAFKIKEVSRFLEERQEIWDAPIFYILIFGLLVTEWILRKWCRLI